MPKVPLSSGLVPKDDTTLLRVRTVGTVYSVRLPETIADKFVRRATGGDHAEQGSWR
jgi:hypothetical protein